MSLKTPQNRSEFESHINLLIEDAVEIIQNTPSARMLKAFRKSKKLPNGRNNLQTVDVQLRLSANMRATLISNVDDLNHPSLKENNDE